MNVLLYEVVVAVVFVRCTRNQGRLPGFSSVARAIKEGCPGFRWLHAQSRKVARVFVGCTCNQGRLPGFSLVARAIKQWRPVFWAPEGGGNLRTGDRHEGDCMVYGSAITGRLSSAIGNHVRVVSREPRAVWIGNHVHVVSREPPANPPRTQGAAPSIIHGRVVTSVALPWAKLCGAFSAGSGRGMMTG